MENYQEKIKQCDADIEARKAFVAQYDKDYIGVFQTAEEALEAAREAQKTLMKDFTVEDRQRFIDAAKVKFSAHLEEMSLLERIETGYGRYEDKLKKNGGSYANTVGTESIPVMTYTGSKGLTMEYFAPFGVVGGITPVTNPSSTIYANSRHNVAVGNAIIFNPHPAARVCSKWSVGLFNEAVVEAGGPANLCVTTDYPTMGTLDVIMKCPFVKLLVGTGGPAMVKTLMTSGKKIIAAGDGNPPCIVDSSADVEKAVVGIIGSSVMENNIMCTAEKEIFVVADVYDKFIAALEKQRTRHLTTEESEILIKECLLPNPDGTYSANKKYVGKDAAVILNAVGIKEDGDPLMAFFETDLMNPFVQTEQMMPIIPVVKCKDFEEALENAVFTENDRKHSASIWTKDLYHATEYGRRINTTVFAMNGGTTAPFGVDGSGTNAPTIATPTGEGITGPHAYARRRRFAMADGMGYIL